MATTDIKWVCFVGVPDHDWVIEPGPESGPIVKSHVDELSKYHKLTSHTLVGVCFIAESFIMLRFDRLWDGFLSIFSYPQCRQLGYLEGARWHLLTKVFSIPESFKSDLHSELLLQERFDENPKYRSFSWQVLRKASEFFGAKTYIGLIRDDVKLAQLVRVRDC